MEEMDHIITEEIDHTSSNLPLIINPDCNKSFSTLTPNCDNIYSEYQLNQNTQNNSIIYISQPQHTIQQPDQLTLEQQEDLKELLQSWDCELIFAKCVEERVDIECLKLFKLHHIEKLTAGIYLGFVVKFEHKLINWQTSIASTVCSTICERDVFEPDTKDVINIKDILEQTNYGLQIISQYKETKTLTDTQRNFIVNGIIDYIMIKNIKMSTNIAKDIAEQIVCLFIYEEIATYYHKVKGKNLSGKIYQKYYNKTKSLENVGLKKKLNTANDEDEPLNKSTKLLVDEENIDFNIAALNANDSTWAEIEEKWKKTSNYRVNKMKNETDTAKILEKWVQYTKPLGHKLILIDFKTMFPEATDMLDIIDKFPSEMLEIYKSKIKDSSAKTLINFLNNGSTSHNGKLLITFYLLHHVLIPTGRAVLTVSNQKLHKKYSIKDSQNSFAIVGNTVDQVEEMLQRRFQENLPVQPLLLVTGTIADPKQICVYYDNIRYKLDCAARAIDICFKTYHVFNLKYPPASFLFYTFVQHFFYKINVKNEHHSVKTLINELKIKSCRKIIENTS